MVRLMSREHHFGTVTTTVYYTTQFQNADTQLIHSA